MKLKSIFRVAVISIAVLAGSLVTSQMASATQTITVTPATAAAGTSTGIYVGSYGSASNAGFDYITFSVAQGQTLWTPTGTCTTLANCGINQFEIAGNGITPLSVSKILGGSAVKITFATKTSGDIDLAFDPGSFLIPSSPSGTYTASIQMFDSTAGNANRGSISGSVAVTASVSSFTVTFDPNGGLGTIANQTNSTSTALTTNNFTKSGYSFSGWAASQADANAGTAAYANGANYPFTSSTTLYAIWTANGSGSGGGSGSGSSGSSSTDASTALATTGMNTLPYLAGGIALIALGMGMIYARRMRTH